MPKLKFLVTAVTILVMLLPAQVTFANPWHAGNLRSSMYGGKANIKTPTSAPTMYGGTESSWVAAAGGYWAQTGWLYAAGWSGAKRYREGLTGAGYTLIQYADHSWNTTINYKVERGTVDVNYWYTSDQDGNAWGWNLGLISHEIQVFLEVQGDSNNQANTQFSNVQSRTSGGIWQNFSQANWTQDIPYGVNSTANPSNWTSLRIGYP